MPDERPIVLAVTGASGSAYAVRLLQVLLQTRHSVELLVSGAARQVAVRELGIDFPPNDAESSEWTAFPERVLKTTPLSAWGFQNVVSPEAPDNGIASQTVHVRSVSDYTAGIASGSFLTGGMIICPCSTGTLSSVACGISTNLIHRAADVHLKERRPLVVVPRETPLSLISLENMVRLTNAGATVLPSMPGFYHHPTCIADLVDFVVARICDHLHIQHNLSARWGSDAPRSREP
ncbi:MAG: UbiX family flavin prenyltransferase [Planctomycetaceae bacterium]|nr:UbiX family flavin prenyltransferase [Planctomycetaceae bacterium]